MLSRPLCVWLADKFGTKF